ncbi:putative F-box domain-containing protein [Helianthus debilis subsp. tardiflorus]
MSNDIPIEVQEEIMKRLPVKSLIQFRSICKAWKSLIDGSDFIKNYSGQQQHLLLGYSGYYDERKYVSVVDNDSFPQQKVYLALPNMLKYFKMIGGSHGLFCLYGKDLDDKRSRAILWNPLLRKVVVVVVPNGIDETKIGFGVCRETMDPKILKITQIERWRDVESLRCIRWQVEVFTLSTGWRRPYSTSLPRTSINFFSLHVAVNGRLYWLAADRIATDGGFRIYKLIISFNLTSEEFGEINLPATLAIQSLSKFIHV